MLPQMVEMTHKWLADAQHIHEAVLIRCSSPTLASVVLTFVAQLLLGHACVVVFQHVTRSCHRVD